MMPYLALGGYSEMFPTQLDPAKGKQIIQTGVNRLLQMTTEDGGLAYWPGGQEATLWGSAYGGFALLKIPVMRSRSAVYTSVASAKSMGRSA